MLFFFSSRRRHTRLSCDWSSDVCSSDRSEEHTSELQSHDKLLCRLIEQNSTRLHSAGTSTTNRDARRCFVFSVGAWVLPCLERKRHHLPHPQTLIFFLSLII